MWMWLIFILIVIIFAVGFILILNFGDDKTNEQNNKILKSLYGTCSNNFDCSLGFHCELRDHPSKGVCVVPPGGACHSANAKIKDVSCYSGYYCDKSEGICLKKE